MALAKAAELTEQKRLLVRDHAEVDGVMYSPGVPQLHGGHSFLVSFPPD